MTTQASSIVRIAFGTAFLLLIPLAAMQFSHDVKWGPFDFIVAGMLLFGAGLTYELIATKGGTLPYRVAVGLSVVTALLLVWVNLAVGLIGDEDNPANVIYAGVLAVLAVGALLARFAPRGLARALFATAAAQMLVTVIGQLAGWESTFLVNSFYAVLWTGAGLLFRRA